jgi:feruloyl esterase
MWRLWFVIFALIAPAAGATCEALLHEVIPHVEILKAEQIDAGHFVPAGSPALSKDGGFSGLPPFCRVSAAVHPVRDSDIRVEVWMPVSAWNGRALGTGNGGFAGSISYSPLASGLKSGYAVANTDMGMATPAGTDASVFIGRPERWRDWGYRATHEMRELEVALIQAYYGRAPAHSYFAGCSTGGEQALMEAQRFPGDYDGISAGAPANNRTGVHLSILWNYMATQREAAAYIPQEKLELLHHAVVAACDLQDGLRDGLIGDPFACNFDPATLLCKVGETEHCLTAAQVETARRVYAGPIAPATGKHLYPGVPKGSELDWGRFGPAPGEKSTPPFAPIFQWVFGQKWDWHTVDLNRDPQLIETLLAKDVNATDGNLSRFRDRGGKLIAYHGLADWLVVPGEALKYRTSVLQNTKGNLGDFYRLYLIPGMAHCGGGSGPNAIDTLQPLVDWVEKGVAPAQLSANRKPTPPTGPLQRPICAYPQMARYRGAGDPNSFVNYDCVNMADGSAMKISP